MAKSTFFKDCNELDISSKARKEYLNVEDLIS